MVIYNVYYLSMAIECMCTISPFRPVCPCSPDRPGSPFSPSPPFSPGLPDSPLRKKNRLLSFFSVADQDPNKDPNYFAGSKYDPVGPGRVVFVGVKGIPTFVYASVTVYYKITFFWHARSRYSRIRMFLPDPFCPFPASAALDTSWTRAAGGPRGTRATSCT